VAATSEVPLPVRTQDKTELRPSSQPATFDAPQQSLRGRHAALGERPGMSPGRIVVGRTNGIVRKPTVGTLHLGERSVNSTLTRVWV
jgi:hypothetical protein